jgi:hypothetical protein
MTEPVILGEKDLGHTGQRRRLGSGGVAALTCDEDVHLAQRRDRGQSLGHGVGRQLAVRHVRKKENSHQITPASFFSFSINSSTEPTLTPALRVSGSDVLTTVSRGVTSTP